MRCATEEFNTRRAGLDVDDLSADPVVQWQRWHDEALEAGVAEPNAMTLSTIGLDDAPDARIVSGSRPRRTWPRVLHQLRQCQEPAAQSSAGRRGDLQLARPPSTGPELVAPSTKCHPTRAMPTSRPGRAARSSAPGHRRRVQRFPTAGRSTPESWQPRPASPASTQVPRPDNWGGWRLLADRMGILAGPAQPTPRPVALHHGSTAVASTAPSTERGRSTASPPDDDEPNTKQDERKVEATMATRRAVHMTGSKVLVVDDEPTVREVVVGYSAP